jgi:DNA-binding CsgD family transcriptional regulator/PAS domain-containing protein
MFADQDHDGLVAHLTESATGDLPWKATLERFADLFQSRIAITQVHDGILQPISVEVHGVSPETAALFYADEVAAHDPRMPYYYQAAKGAVYYDHALFDVAEMDRNPYCRRTNDAIGTKFSLGINLALPNGANAAMGLFFTEAHGHASESAIAAFQRLAPHIQQAFRLGQVIEQKTATQFILLEALARKADGVILLDRAGVPTFVNDAARAILAAGDGLAHGEGGFIADRGPETQRLALMIQAAIAPVGPPAGGPEGRMSVNRRSGRNPYVVTVMPAPRQDRFLSGRSIACVIHIQDLAAVALPSHEALAAVFGLSEREADLVVELIRCPGLAQASAQAGMALNTGRNHLQSIFRKTGATSQAAAIQMLGRLL